LWCRCAAVDQAHGRLEAAAEAAAAAATAAEERHRDAVAEATARASHAAAAREEALVQQMALLRGDLDGAKVRALQRTKQVVASEEEWRVRAEAAEAAAEAAELERDAAVSEVEAMTRAFAAREAAAGDAWAAAARTHRGEVEEAAADAGAARAAAAEAVAAAAAAADARCASLRGEHKATLAAVDERVRSTLGKLQGDNAKLKAQLRVSQEREAALARVFKDQAAELLGGLTIHPQ
jgi:hypothetical protein